MNTVVKTQLGEVRGNAAGAVSKFKGIPYSAAPFGANRFRSPQPVEPWSGVRDARIFGPEAPQLRPDDPKVQSLAPDPAVPGEDCLNLNIWSPDLGSARLPVMVWIHGGHVRVRVGRVRMTAATSPATASSALTINYRLGVDGFSIWAREPPTSACSTRSPPSNGSKRISPPSVVIPATLRSSASRLAP